MDVSQRFDDLTDICHTCGALVVERELHNGWHNQLEAFAERQLGALRLLGVEHGPAMPLAPLVPETATANPVSAPTVPAVASNASEPSPVAPRSEPSSYTHSIENEE